MDKRVVGRWQKDLDRDGFCVVDVCTPAEAAEWKLKVRELDEQRRRASGDSVVDPSTKSVVDPSETGVTVWMTESGEFPEYFLRRLAHPALVLSARAFYPCRHHVRPSSRAATTAYGRQLQHHPNVELLSCKPVLKSKKVAHSSPWHQDWEYWRGTPKVSAWVALDDAKVDNGCLRVIPGSHRWGAIPHEQFRERIGFDNRIPDPKVASLVDQLDAEVRSRVFKHASAPVRFV